MSDVHVPGDLVFVKRGMLVDRYGENEQRWTARTEPGVIIIPSHRYEEPGRIQDEPGRFYVVLLNPQRPTFPHSSLWDDYAEPGLYVVPSSAIVTVT